MISFIVVFILGIAQAFFGRTGILQFITLYSGFFFLQQDGWLRKTDNQHVSFLRDHQHQSITEHITTQLSRKHGRGSMCVLKVRVGLFAAEFGRWAMNRRFFIDQSDADNFLRTR
jgi:hypothetical protein